MSARGIAARRSWLFVDGADESALEAATGSGADVLIQELEDFTPPARRPEARTLSPNVMSLWKVAGVAAAVRINPLEGDGGEDLAAVMRGAPELILLPKASRPEQVARLDDEITRLETELGVEVGSTEIVPNVELAEGLLNTYAICRSSPRVSACVVASEDMAADLGAERGRDALELDHVRTRFHLECTAARVLSVDCPYTWTDLEGLESDTLMARRLGYRAKSAVRQEHVAVINRVLTPDATEIERARRVVAAFEEAVAAGRGRIEVDGSMVEVPVYLNAKRLLERAAELGVV